MRNNIFKTLAIPCLINAPLLLVISFSGYLIPQKLSNTILYVFTLLGALMLGIGLTAIYRMLWDQDKKIDKLLDQIKK